MKLVIILFSALMINACACQKSNANDNMKSEAKVSSHTQSDKLSDTYVITSINGNESTNEKVTLNFDSKTNTVTGFTGCNQFSGSYTQKEDGLIFGNIAATEMFCENTAKIEQEFISALSKTTKFTLNNGQLVLQSKKGNLLHAIDNSNENTIKTNQEKEDQVLYTSMSRGTFFEAKLIGNSLSVIKIRGQKPNVIKVADKDVKVINRLIASIDLKTIHKIDSPTKYRLFDGASHANISIIRDSQLYKGAGFDGGHPPKELEALVNKLLSLTDKK